MRHRVFGSTCRLFEATEPEPAADLLRVDPAVRDRQVARLATIRAKRDPLATARLLERLEQAARGTENTMPRILACVEGFCTLGEISDALRNAFGEANGFGLI